MQHASRGKTFHSFLDGIGRRELNQRVGPELALRKFFLNKFLDFWILDREEAPGIRFVVRNYALV